MYFNFQTTIFKPYDTPAYIFWRIPDFQKMENSKNILFMEVFFLHRSINSSWDRGAERSTIKSYVDINRDFVIVHIVQTFYLLQKKTIKQEWLWGIALVFFLNFSYNM